MISYTIDHDNNCIFVQNTDICTTDTVLEHIHRLLDDPNYQNGMNEIVDLRHIDEYAVDPDGIRKVVELKRQKKEDLKLIRIAIVCSGDLVFGMSRMFQALSSELGLDIQVYRNCEEAFRFVNVDIKELRQLDDLLEKMTQ